MKNLNGTGSNQFYFFLALNQGGSAYIDSLSFFDSYTGYQVGIYIEESINHLVIKNSYFNNLKLASGNSLINTGTFNDLQIINTTFSNIQNQNLDDDDNYMIVIDTINLGSAENSIIKNISVQSSSIAFINFNSIVGTTSTPMSFTLQDIYYSNWYFAIHRNLIQFGNLESTENIQFLINNIQFNNIIFNKQGNMLVLMQQLKQKMLLQNSNFTNIQSGYIHIEASNKQNINILTEIQIVNSSFSLIDAEYGSLLTLNEGGRLEIIDWYFEQISCWEEGAILHAGYRKTETYISNSVFINNTSVQGGIFIVESESMINCNNWSISYNFAVISGVIQVINNGYFQLFNSELHHNYAISSSISQILDVATTPIIDNSKFHDNLVLSSDTVQIEINTACFYLWFLQKSYKDYLKSHTNVYTIESTYLLFELIQANLVIRNSTQIYNDRSVVSAFISTFTLIDSMLYNLSILSYAFKFTSSNATISNSKFSGISTIDNTSLFQTSFQSSVEFNNLEFNDSKLSFLSLLSSTLNFQLISIKNISSDTSLISISSGDLLITDSIIESSHSSIEWLWDISASTGSLISNFTIKNTINSPLCIAYSSIIMINGLSGVWCSNHFHFDSTVIKEMINSTFISVGETSLKNGGAIYLSNSNITISNSKFTGNIATDGGAIYYSWSDPIYWVVYINNCVFLNNKATQAGGAIKYNFYRPILSNNTFENNTAQYGPIIGSYPIKIKMKESTSDQITFDNVVSGISENITILCALYDHDDQITSLDNISQLELRSIVSNTKVTGYILVKVTEGVGKFEDIIFYGTPGSYNVKFSLNSKSLNMNILRKQYGSNYSLKDVIVNFRYWKPGEIITGNYWTQCSEGSYSFIWNSTVWEPWLSNAFWLGMEKVSLDSGYWRNTGNSTMIIECPNRLAWSGGYNKNNTHPVNCAPGYDGLLWSDCKLFEGEKYERLSDFQWSVCPNPVTNGIRVVGLLILILIFIGILVTVNIRK